MSRDQERAEKFIQRLTKGFRQDHPDPQKEWDKPETGKRVPNDSATIFLPERVQGIMSGPRSGGSGLSQGFRDHMRAIHRRHRQVRGEAIARDDEFPGNR